MSISAIYSAISAMTVAVNGATATVYGLTNMPDAIETAHLPVRLIVSVGGNTQGTSTKSVTLGSAPRLHSTWQVQDLMLYKPPTQGTGLDEMNAVLMGYCDDYLSAIRTHVQLTSTALITDVRLEPGIYQHPPGSERQYFGVMGMLTIEEIY